MKQIILNGKTTLKNSAIVFKQDTKFNMMLNKIKETLILWTNELPH